MQARQLSVTVITPRKPYKRPRTLVERLWPLTFLGIEPPVLGLNLVMETELL